MTELGDEADAAAFIPELAGLLLSEETVAGLLDVIVNLAVAAVDDLAGASVSLVLRDGGRLETTDSSSEAIRHIDEVQYRDSAGPCVEAIRTGQEVRLILPTDRWPDFGDQATQAGMRSVWSLPLTVRDRTTGALNLYSDQPDGWQPAVGGPARALARQAAVVLANAATLMSAQLANEHLQDALESRDVIGQAKGILMAREALNPDEAFDVLRRASQRTNRKLRDVAAELIARQARPDSRA